MSIQENLATVKKRIEAAARRVSRAPSSVKFIAVSKGKPIEDIIEAMKAGQLAFGENYAQELRDKHRQIADCQSEIRNPKSAIPLEWHFIGHLQKNKIKYVLPIAAWIHAIDSIELIEAIAKKIPPSPPLKKGGEGGFPPINFLIEVNVSGEATKSGIVSDQVFSLVEAFAKLCSPIAPLHHCPIALRGLMCMPPFSDNPESSRPYFKELACLLNEINKRAIYPTPLTELSMGMTQDFEVAIEEGATMVRIGTAIFGAR